jgi:hypothetical protein
MSLEGNGGPSGGVPHYLQSSAQASLCSIGSGQSEGSKLSPCRGSSDPLIEAGAPNTGELQASMARVCARPTGGSHGRTTDDPAQRF